MSANGELVRTKAIVLRRTNYGEADRIIQLLTPQGRYGAMVKGARREKSKLAGGIELFTVSDIVLRKGRGDLFTLTSASLVYFYREILADYDRLQFGYDAISLVSKASDAIDEPEWFDVLFEVLKALNLASIPLDLIKVWFYVHYAALLGVQLNVQRDSTGAKLYEGGRYMYDVSERSLRETPDGSITSDHIKLLRLVNGSPLSALVKVGGLANILPDCLVLARQHAVIS